MSETNAASPEPTPESARPSGSAEMSEEGPTLPPRLSALQRDGTYALSLAQRFGNLDLTRLKGSDAIYFDLFGRTLVRYPAAWALPLARWPPRCGGW